MRTIVPELPNKDWACGALDLRTQVLLHRTPGFKSNDMAVRELARRLVYTQLEYDSSMVDLYNSLAARMKQ